MTDRYAADFRIEGEGLTAGDVDEVKIQLWELADAFGGSVIVQRKPWPGPLDADVPSVPALPVRATELLQSATVPDGPSLTGGFDDSIEIPELPVVPSVPADADLRDRIRGVIRDCPALYPDDIADRVADALLARRPFDARAGLQRLADDLRKAECACDPAPHREGDGTYSHWAGCPVADAEQLLDERVAAAQEQVESPEDRCAECGHWRAVHQPGDDPVTPGICAVCDEDDARHDYEATAEAQKPVEPETFGPDVVAYRHPTKPRAYLCRQHGDGKPGLTPVEADDLEYGGGCDECGVDVLIPQQQAEEFGPPLRDRLRRAFCEASGFDWDPDSWEPDEYGEQADAAIAIFREEAAR